MRFTQLSALIAAAALSVGSVSAFAKPVQLTDTVGRKVTVDLPAKRVVLGFYYQDYMAIGGKTALDNVVGFSKAVWADWAPPSWAAFSKAVPKLNQLTDVGEVAVGTFSLPVVDFVPEPRTHCQKMVPSNCACNSFPLTNRREAAKRA